MGVIFYIGVAVITPIILLKLYILFLVKYCRSKVSLVDKTVIVTGGNAGIGYETALDLACRGARTILACRNEQRGKAAAEKIIKLTNNKNVLVKILDLSSIKSIRNFAKDIVENEKKVDILINNAGIVGSESLTEDGMQLMWQSNHFGPMLLTLLLLDVLKKSAPSRIVNVSSSAAKMFSKLTLSTLNKHIANMETYADTKLANIFFTQELAKKLKGTNVSVFSLHPGAVKTDIVPDNLLGLIKPIFKLMVYLFYLTPEEGCQTTLYCACEQGIEDLSGSHFEYCHVVEPYKSAQDSTLAKQVWDESLKLIKYDKTE